MSESSPEESNSSEGSHGTFTLGQERKLSCSQSFEPNDLVPLLYTAIKHAYKKRGTIKREIWKLEKKKLYRFPKALRLVDQKGLTKKDKAQVETKYEWGKLEFRLGQPIIGLQPNTGAGKRSKTSKTMHDPEKNKVYYVIGNLGDGATSRVFHAIDSKGEEVAIKLYIKREDNATVTSDNGEKEGEKRKTENTISKSQFDEAAEAATEREKERLKKQYDFLKEEVSTATFFENMHAVVMPVFTPVEKKGRKEALEKILPALNMLASSGFKYANDDIRWRHVGRYKEKHFVLFDLADLEETKDSKEDIVKNHIDKLKERHKAGSDESSVSRQGIVGESEA